MRYLLKDLPGPVLGAMSGQNRVPQASRPYSKAKRTYLQREQTNTWLQPLQEAPEEGQEGVSEPEAVPEAAPNQTAVVPYQNPYVLLPNP